MFKIDLRGGSGEKGSSLVTVTVGGGVCFASFLTQLFSNQNLRTFKVSTCASVRDRFFFLSAKFNLVLFIDSSIF